MTKKVKRRGKNGIIHRSQDSFHDHGQPIKNGAGGLDSRVEQQWAASSIPMQGKIV
jgi:hypothetical protein